MALALDLDYSSYQDIREEAGQHHLVKTEIPSGVVDGTNTVFFVGRTYIVDRNYNDVIDVGIANGDVIVYVNEIAVEVTAVDPVTGAITLDAAPQVNDKVIINYAYSLLSDIKVDKYRAEAIDYVHRKINGIIDFGAWESSDVPPLVHTVVRLFAGGLILVRDQGFNTDTEDSSKDGYKKIQSAKSLLQDYLDEISDAAGSTSRVSTVGVSDGNIFRRNPDLSSWNNCTDNTECFMRNDC